MWFFQSLFKVRKKAKTLDDMLVNHRFEDSVSALRSNESIDNLGLVLIIIAKSLENTWVR